MADSRTALRNLLMRTRAAVVDRRSGHGSFEISLDLLQALEEYGLVVAPGYLTPQMLEAAREVADLDDET